MKDAAGDSDGRVVFRRRVLWVVLLIVGYHRFRCLGPGPFRAQFTTALVQYHLLMLLIYARRIQN